MTTTVRTGKDLDDLITSIVYREGTNGISDDQLYDLLCDPEYLLENFDAVVDAVSVERDEKRQRRKAKIASRPQFYGPPRY